MSTPIIGMRKLHIDRKLMAISRKWWSLPAWLGASGVLTLLGMDTVTQNLITYRYDSLPSKTECSVKIARFYDGWTTALSGSPLGDQGPEAAMVSYGIFGFAFGPNVIDSSSTIEDSVSLHGLNSCDSGNCTYGNYSTMSICSKCADISKEIAEQSGRYTLRSDAVSLNMGNGTINVTSFTEYPTQGEFAKEPVGPLLVHYMALVHDTRPFDYNVAPAAVECVAYWCVATYNSSVLDNSFVELAANDHTTSLVDYINGGTDHLNDDSFTNTTDVAKTVYGQEQDVYITPTSCYLDLSLIHI